LFWHASNSVYDYFEQLSNNIMKILQMHIIVEPDRQRFAGFVIEIASAIGMSSLQVAMKLSAILENMRREASKNNQIIKAAAGIDNDKFVISWQGYSAVLGSLTRPLCDLSLRDIIENFRKKIEFVDPGLLRRQNQKVQGDLERTKKIADLQMAELETALAKKKEEVKLYIRESETDALTGLLNRRAYDQKLLGFMRRSLREKTLLSLIFLDMDNFKKVNDDFGHQVGDELLRKMARVMKGSIRKDVDLSFRIGGDEFAIILFADSSKAKRVVQNILKGMDGKVSIGIAFMEASDTPETLAARADKALYSAKDGGRGQFRFI